ncbi:LAETG motif-containing sortase-dependent surface protein [Streptomyces cinnamoneus]|uniref:LAETG motif-containing sortase-dependent surface protein n=1 Tax=Streptomyces cinnamoneus TaxID=53446 RepID=UPI00379A1F6C
MKFRRTLATAAVMAAVGPVALLAAPGAVLTSLGPLSQLVASPAHAAEHAPAADGKPAASAAPSAAPSPIGRPGEETRPSTGPGSGTTDGSRPAPSAKPSAAPSTPSAEPSKAPQVTPSPSFSRSGSCSPIFDEDRGKTGLRGLPSKIVAGSGWHEFTYRVTNVSKVTVMEADVSLMLGTADPKLDDIAQLDVTVEWYNPATRSWKAIEGGGAGALDNYDFATVKNIKPGEYADAKMRIKAGDKAQAGTGYFFTIGHSFGADGKCGSDGISQFDFTVLTPGSKPGKVGDAKGKPGKPGSVEQAHKAEQAAAGNKATAQGERAEIPVTGKLAETGSSSAVPVVAGIGGAAVVAGAGALFLVKRRKGNASA